MKLDSTQLERVAALFRAFAESTRLAIVQELKSGELSVSEIVDNLTTSQANVSKQLKLLHDAGIVSRRKQAERIPLWHPAGRPASSSRATGRAEGGSSGIPVRFPLWMRL